MTMLPPAGHAHDAVKAPPAANGLEKVLRSMSVITMLMTVPQVYTVWVAHNASGVSIASWGTYLVSACLWLVYGVRKKDKTIYLACIGWIVLDVAIVVGVIAADRMH